MKDLKKNKMEKTSTVISSWDIVLDNFSNFECLKLFPSSYTLAKLATYEEEKKFFSWKNLKPMYLRQSRAQELYG